MAFLRKGQVRFFSRPSLVFRPCRDPDTRLCNPVLDSVAWLSEASRTTAGAVRRSEVLRSSALQAELNCHAALQQNPGSVPGRDSWAT